MLHFGRQFGDLVATPENIESIKVHACNKRVKMIFDVAESQSGFIVRYACVIG